MKETTDKNGNVIIYFDNDEEFYEFCVDPKLIPIAYKSNISNSTKYYVDFNFSEEYKKAISEGKRFIIKDQNSQILKHGEISYRTITKRIDNLDPFFEKY